MPLFRITISQLRSLLLFSVVFFALWIADLQSCSAISGVYAVEIQLSTPSLPPAAHLLPHSLLNVPLSTLPSDTPHSHDLQEEKQRIFESSDNLDRSSGAYEPDFFGLDRSIIGRASDSQNILPDTPFNDTVLPGTIRYYYFPGSQTGGRYHSRRNGSAEWAELTDVEPRTREADAEDDILDINVRQESQASIYITITTCVQPSFSSSQDQAVPPQLELWVSDSGNEQPGPDSTGGTRNKTLEEGYAEISLNTTNTVYISVWAQPVSISSGIWNYELAVSVITPYHSFNTSNTTLYLIDSDSRAALLITKNLSTSDPVYENVTGTPQTAPLDLFVQKGNGPIDGLRHSYCGLKNNAQISSANISANVSTGLASYTSSVLEQQFYVPRLESYANYTGIIARNGSFTNQGIRVPGGGGTVYPSMTFKTKRYDNCALLYNLSFCSSVAYSVPANPSINTTMLAGLYDNTTQAAYKFFNYSLQQTACNTTATAQYSLARNCTDCAAAYKTWLCAVSIPRCADWEAPPDLPSADSTNYLMPRNAAQTPLAATPDITPVTNQTLLRWNATNGSRNEAVVNQKVNPGPYMEVLPCEDLCYELVRSCPAALGFGCPYPGKGLEWSYGKVGMDEDGGPTCNAPGAVWGVSEAGRARVWGAIWAVVLIAATVVM